MLKELLEKIDSIQKMLTFLFSFHKEHLSLKEAAMYLSLSESALYKLKDAGMIPFYKPNGKIYFKRRELDAWIYESRVSSSKELEELCKN